MAYDDYGRSRQRRETGFSRSNMGSPSRGYGRERMSSRDEDRARGYGRSEAYDREDRDFFERASDEVRSWFGDERAEQRREMDERMGLSGRGYVNQRYTFEDSPRSINEGYRRPYTGRRYDRTPFEATNFDEQNYDYDRGYTQNRFGRGMTQSEYTSLDSDYSNWRQRQIDELDRDYAEWRSENSRRFDDEFSSWRGDRVQKRSLMQQIPDHAEVIGSDGEHVGTVDKLRGDRIILTKNDSPDGQHHSLTCSRLDCIDDGKVRLNITSEEARQMWRDEDRGRSSQDTLQLRSRDEVTSERSLADNS
ncbi:DUF2171 domain-containing protein [Sphingomicrobium flavum]|uniref:DUF2171 domain-containing protein n=1 Tax=Sphingomicrobium flavum TaxID=1229164 RepID=UPI0021ADCB89|nr:DUF2171 domain-containing protein [Sphingomicrobium flavum]